MIRQRFVLSTVSFLFGLVLLLAGCVPVDGGSWYGPGTRGGYGGSGPDGRRYARADVEYHWIGATYGEVLDNWGEPYERAYMDYEQVGENDFIGWGPYMAYVEVVRDPYGGRPGAVEHIYFILDQDFRRVERIDFSDEVEWWGGDVEVPMMGDDW